MPDRHLIPPCGTTLAKRIVKPGMSDGLGDVRGGASDPLAALRIYEDTDRRLAAGPAAHASR